MAPVSDLLVEEKRRFVKALAELSPAGVPSIRMVQISLFGIYQRARYSTMMSDRIHNINNIDEPPHEDWDTLVAPLLAVRDFEAAFEGDFSWFCFC